MGIIFYLRRCILSLKYSISEVTFDLGFLFGVLSHFSSLSYSWITYYLGRTSASNGKLLWCYMWHMCLLGNCNLQQQRYLGLMTSGVSRDEFRELGQTIEIMTRPDAKWRRPALQWRHHIHGTPCRAWVHSLMASLTPMALLVEHG